MTRIVSILAQTSDLRHMRMVAGIWEARGCEGRILPFVGGSRFGGVWWSTSAMGRVSESCGIGCRVLETIEYRQPMMRSETGQGPESLGLAGTGY